jgi:hypothetical protein
MRRIEHVMAGARRDAVTAGLVAAVAGGIPSTAYAAARRRDVLEGARAAGTIVLPHATRTAPLLAALDLGIIGRRLPAIRALEQPPQWLDHAAYGLTVGVVLRRRRSRRAAGRA